MVRGFSEIGVTQDQENCWLSTVAPELTILPSGFVREIFIELSPVGGRIPVKTTVSPRP
ncbi:hypothetical protein D3C83_141820 [compost metagenome]